MTTPTPTPSAETLEKVRKFLAIGDGCHCNFMNLCWLHKHLLSEFPEIASLCESQAKEIEVLRGALDILKKNVVLAVRRAERGLRTQANPLIDLKEVIEALPSLETLLGTIPLCDRCNQACFKDCSEYCDIALCQKCSDIPPTLSANSQSL